jgi:hypothetical protein
MESFLYVMNSMTKLIILVILVSMRQGAFFGPEKHVVACAGGFVNCRTSIDDHSKVML